MFQRVFSRVMVGVKTRVFVLYFRGFWDDCCGGLELVFMFCTSESFGMIVVGG